MKQSSETDEYVIGTEDIFPLIQSFHIDLASLSSSLGSLKDLWNSGFLPSKLFDTLQLLNICLMLVEILYQTIRIQSQLH